MGSPQNRQAILRKLLGGAMIEYNLIIKCKANAGLMQAIMDEIANRFSQIDFMVEMNSEIDMELRFNEFVITREGKYIIPVCYIKSTVYKGKDDLHTTAEIVCEIKYEETI